MAEKLATLEVAQARLDERVEDLEDWRRRTNGHLERIESKIERLDAKFNGLGWAVAGALGGILVQIVLSVVR